MRPEVLNALLAIPYAMLLLGVFIWSLKSQRGHLLSWLIWSATFGLGMGVGMLRAGGGPGEAALMAFVFAPLVVGANEMRYWLRHEVYRRNDVRNGTHDIFGNPRCDP